MHKHYKFGAVTAVVALTASSFGVAGAATKSAVSGDFATTLTPQVVKMFGKPFPVVKGNTARGVTKNTINIGIVSDLTTGGQPIYFGGCEGAKARFERANRTNELQHKIVVTDCLDSTSDTNKFASQAKDLVEGKKSFGLVAVGTASSQSSKYLEDMHVPTVGWGIVPPFCGWDKPFGLGFAGVQTCAPMNPADPTKYALSNLLVGGFASVTGKNPKDLRVAVISEQNPAGTAGMKVQQAGIEYVGATVVYNKDALPAPPTPVTDFTPYITDILKTNPNLVELSVSAGVVPGLAAGLKAAGYKGDVLQFVYFDSGILAVKDLASAVDGTYALTPGFGSPAFGGAAWDQAAADTAAIGQGGKFYCDKLPSGGFVGCGLGFTTHYNSADVWVSAIKALEKSKKPFTTENFVNFINAGWSYPGVGNMSCPVTFPLGHVVGSPCGSFVQWDVANNRLKPVSDLTTYKTELVTVK